MKYFTIRHYGVPHDLAVPTDQLDRLRRRYAPLYAARPILAMAMAALCMKTRCDKTPALEQERLGFLKWYMSDYAEDTPRGRRFPTIQPTPVPKTGQRYLQFDETTGNAHITRFVGSSVKGAAG